MAHAMGQACEAGRTAFLAGLLTRDPTTRLTAAEALEHPWFREQLGGGGAVRSADGEGVEAAVSSVSSADASNIVPLGDDHHHGGPHMAAPPTSCAWYAPATPPAGGLAMA